MDARVCKGDDIAVVWNALVLDPMMNGLVVLYSFLFGNFGLAIIVFTVIVRIITHPLTARQMRSTRRMSELQPKVAEIKRRYAKDSRRVSQETMRLYKESGVNPLGCLGPLVIQFPIWIGLYQSILQLLPTSPEALARLSQHLYSWLPFADTVVPLNSKFLWLDLSVPDPSPFVMPVLVGVSMWLQQKMTMMPSPDPRTASTNRTMLWMMPIMFGFFTLNFESGLALYWIVSNIVGIIIQGFITGWEPLIGVLHFIKNPLNSNRITDLSSTHEKNDLIDNSTQESMTSENDRDDRQNVRRGNRDRPKRTQRRQGGRRNRRR